jgi:hypothetical protein
MFSFFLFFFFNLTNTVCLNKFFGRNSDSSLQSVALISNFSGSFFPLYFPVFCFRFSFVPFLCPLSRALCNLSLVLCPLSSILWSTVPFSVLCLPSSFLLHNHPLPVVIVPLSHVIWCFSVTDLCSSVSRSLSSVLCLPSFVSCPLSPVLCLLSLILLSPSSVP